jgi:hypothetical protein
MLDEQAWTQYINLDDPVIKKTLEVFENHAAFPKKPEPAKKRAAKKEKIAMANGKEYRNREYCCMLGGVSYLTSIRFTKYLRAIITFVSLPLREEVNRYSYRN